MGAREALLPELFEVLLRAFEQTYEADRSVAAAVSIKVDELRRELRKYAGLLEIGAKIASAAEKALNLHGITLVFSLLKAAAKKPGISLADQKAKVIKLLREVRRRVVILVGDLDRLEPKDAAEVLRLVKAVADFPNTIYLLACAPELLANAVENQLKVPNGQSFLEKIVHISHAVPPPDDYDLRHWLRAGIDIIIAEVFKAKPIPAYKDRLAQLMSNEAERMLRTPRDVVRSPTRSASPGARSRPRSISSILSG